MTIQSSQEKKSTSKSENSESDKRKQSMYFPAGMLAEIQSQATRLDRSMSWIMQQTWRIAKQEVASFHAFEDKPQTEDVKTD